MPGCVLIRKHRSSGWRRSGVCSRSAVCLGRCADCGHQATRLLVGGAGQPDTSLCAACEYRPSLAATELSIHRNTLSYRLDKIASLTGLDPRRFDDAVQIRLALLLRSLRNDSGS